MKLTLLILGVVVNVAYACTNPLLYKAIIDVALPAKNIHLLTVLLFSIVMLFCMAVIFTLIQNYVAADMGNRIVNHLRLAMFRRIQNLNFNNQTKHYAEEVLTQFTEDISFLEHTLVYTICIVTQYIIIGIISITLLFYISWVMTILVALMMPLMVLLPKWLISKGNRYFSKKKSLEADLVAIEKEGMSEQASIRYLRLKNYKRKIFTKLLKNLAKESYLYDMHISLASRSAILSINLVMILALSMGIYLVVIDYLTFGALLSFLILLSNVGSAINFLSSHYPSISRSEQGLKRIEGLIYSVGETQNDGAKVSFEQPKKSIIFNRIYAHQGEHEVITDVSMTLPIHKSIAIVGVSGSGKSTLLKLLLREIAPTKGHILIDGKDIKDVTLNSYYSRFGFVSQHPVVFSGTIKENIRLGKLDATDDEIIKVCQEVSIHEDIMALVNGYDTVLNDTNQLSGGQKQRLTVARAIIANPNILCLDEATAGLDPITATALNETFKRMSKNMTIISVTHHLQFAAGMDHIVVIDKGKLVAQGTHQSLMKQRGVYYRLWQKQHSVIFTPEMDQANITIDGLKMIPLFQDLDDVALKLLSEEFVLHKVEANHCVFTEGDQGDNFYIIAYGDVLVMRLDNITHKNKIISTLTEGDFFGEMSLLYDEPRNASIMTVGVCLFMTLNRQQFHRILMKSNKLVREKIINVAKERNKYHCI